MLNKQYMPQMQNLPQYGPQLQTQYNRPRTAKSVKVPLTGVYDRNGNPVLNTFVKIPHFTKYDASRINNFYKNKNQSPNPNRKLIFGAIGGLVNTATSAVGLGNVVPGGQAGEEGNGAMGAAVGIGAAGAGMAARKARKEQFYFDKTRLELQTNMQIFRRDYLDLEYTTLRESNRHAAKINGLLSALENNLVYRLNSRLLEMIDAT
jgi:hypothetical protein